MESIVEDENNVTMVAPTASTTIQGVRPTMARNKARAADVRRSHQSQVPLTWQKRSLRRSGLLSRREQRERMPEEKVSEHAISRIASRAGMPPDRSTTVRGRILRYAGKNFFFLQRCSVLILWPFEFRPMSSGRGL